MCVLEGTREQVLGGGVKFGLDFMEGGKDGVGLGMRVEFRFGGGGPDHLLQPHSWQPGIQNPYRGTVVWMVPENVDISVTLYRVSLQPHAPPR